VFEDLYHYMRSLAVIQSMKPARLYPGHGPVVSDPETHVQMYIDNRNNREKQILSALSSGATDQSFAVMDLVKIIYTVTELYYTCFSYTLAPDKNILQNFRVIFFPVSFFRDFVC